MLIWAAAQPRLLFLLAKEEKEAKRRMPEGANNTAILIEKSARFGHSRYFGGIQFANSFPKRRRGAPRRRDLLRKVRGVLTDSAAPHGGTSPPMYPPALRGSLGGKARFFHWGRRPVKFRAALFKGRRFPKAAPLVARRTAPAGAFRGQPARRAGSWAEIGRNAFPKGAFLPPQRRLGAQPPHSGGS